MTSVPQNKTELLAAIQQAFDKILQEYRTFDLECARQLGVEGSSKGTKISVADTLAYLIGWQNLVLKWYCKKQRDEPIDFPESGYKWNELGKLANKFYQQYQNWDYNDLLQEFITTSKALIDLVESLDNQQLYGESWYKQWTLGRMIQFNSSSPMKNMRNKIRKFKRQSAV
ncbi:ClbS/DfsB family four-helix bundle protein [Testudinibacter sp. TR-2022]|uniref:ClbS/DfsB family four-helix bundle protein n=1 Tax=Testudinibacter sp. TR-2022 TaxID=2585029 RepID=UPI00111A77C1|nr:ClbS/DfsB family four-helix bundle protein [Testudinibacter sp. TR-2022]TNH04694.1 ClbS/DfsB family four-helix bundle protein [Pasteurellaceae bacterium Phil31]TNH10148.1 ClbS/DfsB family four-helix bundle protein [Testudinibacter sp. TR-2022]TNH12503.1 ClbS/DfsB family four-helix bundle protein [Testudinibacter sp. TR-2022]TNH15402.1 ClbS/DfsB family four-helix bundle protein [Testudinibacter sp. TR-2022]TNH17102.1 ClbS/DfsB family four-helix bundle protein [Testudinibacter sp. TR-2022]